MFAFRDNAKKQIQCVQKALISGATFVGVESRGGGGAFLLCIVPLLQINSKNFNHPTRGNFVVAMAGS